MGRSRSDYGRGASVYDALGAIYSAGAISKAKRVHLDWLAPNARVLYAGSGSGAEALEAAQRGAQVSLLDSSSAMLDLARARFEKHGVVAGFQLGELRPGAASFDVVAAHFFLNVFAPGELQAATNALLSRLEPGGVLVLADFAAPDTHPALRLLQKAYYLPPLALFRVLARNPLHELYDYPTLFRAIAPSLRLERRVTVQAWGAPFYEALCFRYGAP